MSATAARRALPSAALLLPALLAPPTAPRAAVEVHFSPRGGCTDAAVRAIDGAKSSIRVQAYSFTSRPICDALARARARGVDVRACLDRRQASGRGALGGALAAAGAAVRLDGAHPIAHSKVLVVDARLVLTGSFNWSAQAEENLENLVLLRDPAVAALYLADWDAHAAHAAPLAGPPARAATRGGR